MKLGPKIPVYNLSKNKYQDFWFEDTVTPYLECYKLSATGLEEAPVPAKVSGQYQRGEGI